MVIVSSHPPPSRPSAFMAAVLLTFLGVSRLMQNAGTLSQAPAPKLDLSWRVQSPGSPLPDMLQKDWVATRQQGMAKLMQTKGTCSPGPTPNLTLSLSWRAGRNISCLLCLTSCEEAATAPKLNVAKAPD